jgi:hypothetical protein
VTTPTITSVRAYILEPLVTHRSANSNPSWRSLTPYVRLWEILPGPGLEVLFRAHFCIRKDLAQIICSVLGQHESGYRAVDRLFLHERWYPTLSSAEVQVLNRMFASRGEVLDRNVVMAHIAGIVQPRDEENSLGNRLQNAIRSLLRFGSRESQR